MNQQSISRTAHPPLKITFNLSQWERRIYDDWPIRLFFQTNLTLLLFQETKFFHGGKGVTRITRFDKFNKKAIDQFLKGWTVTASSWIRKKWTESGGSNLSLERSKFNLITNTPGGLPPSLWILMLTGTIRAVQFNLISSCETSRKKLTSINCKLQTLVNLKPVALAVLHCIDIWDDSFH